MGVGESWGGVGGHWCGTREGERREERVRVGARTERQQRKGKEEQEEEGRRVEREKGSEIRKVSMATGNERVQPRGSPSFSFSPNPSLLPHSFSSSSSSSSVFILTRWVGIAALFSISLSRGAQLLSDWLREDEKLLLSTVISDVSVAPAGCFSRR